jgi:hypothetical protein
MRSLGPSDPKKPSSLPLYNPTSRERQAWTGSSLYRFTQLSARLQESGGGGDDSHEASTDLGGGTLELRRRSSASGARGSGASRGSRDSAVGAGVGSRGNSGAGRGSGSRGVLNRGRKSTSGVGSTRGLNGVGDGARAVRDGEGGGLGDGVGLLAVGDSGRGGADGGQVSDDLIVILANRFERILPSGTYSGLVDGSLGLRGVAGEAGGGVVGRRGGLVGGGSNLGGGVDLGRVAVAVGGRGGANDGSGGNSETHFDCWGCYYGWY